MTTDLSKFDGVKAAIEKAKKENENRIFDYESPKGNKDARSYIYSLRKMKPITLAIHKETKADALAACQAIDTQKREIIEAIDEMIEVHATPIKAIEDREAAEIAAKAEAERVAKEKAESERLADLQVREEAADKKQAELDAQQEAIEAKEREQREAAEQADREKAEAIEREKKAEADRIAAEKQAEENKRLEAERVEREKRIALESAEKARKEAEAKSEREKQAIKDEAERVRKEEAAKVKAAEEAKRKKDEADAAIESERVANEKHRAKIEKTVLKMFVSKGMPDEIARVFVANLSENKYPELSINY